MLAWLSNDSACLLIGNPFLTTSFQCKQKKKGNRDQRETLDVSLDDHQVSTEIVSAVRYCMKS